MPTIPVGPGAGLTQYGFVRLATAPASGDDPVAVGDNDPRLSGGGAPSGPAGGSLASTYPNPTLSAVGTAGTYGSATKVAVLTTTSEGRVSAVTETTIAGVAPGGSAGGDLTGSYPSPTLAAAGTAGTYGDATHVPVFTTDSKGRVTAVTNTAITTTPPATVVNGGRLTLTTGVPVTTSDVATATSVYWTPYISGSITLWNGSALTTITQDEVSVALGTITTLRPYDVFGYLSSGALVLEILAWTSDTARATALSYQNGLLSKVGDATRRYLGTFRTISTTQTTDTAKQRFLWNMDNRVPRELAVYDTTSSWAWSGATGYRQVRNTATNMVEVLSGLAETPVTLHASLFCGFPPPTATAQTVATAIGLDSTSAAAADQVGGGQWGGTSTYATAHSHYFGVPGLGYHYLAWLEGRNANSGSMSFYGAQGAPNMISSGMVGSTVQ